MKNILLPLVLLFLSITAIGSTPDLGTYYIEAWKKFYPSKAVDQGIQTAIFDYENLTPERIQLWLAFNKEILKQLEKPNSLYAQANSIDARLLKVQVKKEVDIWEQKAVHQHSLTLYTKLIEQATDKVLSVSYLTKKEKQQLICQRLEAIQNLCVAAKQSIKQLDEKEVGKGMAQLQNALTYYKQVLPEKTANWTLPSSCSSFQTISSSIQSLIKHVETTLATTAVAYKPVLGKIEYARRLALYTDSDLTPEQLEVLALTEIETVRDLIGEVSKDYLQEQYPNKDVPKNNKAIIKTAFADMEKDAPISGADYLQFWLELEEAAINFIKEKDIATLPEFQTLRIIPAPESAGPAARIGWVDSAPPFAPNPLTTLYLPSIPDTLPAQEQKDFWASFNKPFNRMIVIHELFPGHYMQIKISRETPHPIRLLFPYAVYFEGWATFTERVLLDAGWEKENPLTFLAHLRKRLENANRAYTSVQVHCNDWTQEQVLQFSTEQSLLAPQFAKSLWGRIMRSPMQLTSYFLGGQQFTNLLAAEKKRLGPDFNLKEFMDTIMQVGAIPIDEFPGVFKGQ